MVIATAEQEEDMWFAAANVLGWLPSIIFHLSRAILLGFRKQMVVDGKFRDGFVGMMAEPWDDMPILHVGMTAADVDKAVQNGEEVFRDDMTGQMLSPELVHAARRK